MKYFLDTEFIEGTQKSWFGRNTKPTIDLISIICEHNALSDAKWNKELYEFLNAL